MTICNSDKQKNNSIINIDEKQLILIAASSAKDKAALTDMLKEHFCVLGVSDAKECLEKIEKYGKRLSLVLIDMVIWENSEISSAMTKNKLTDDVPVIMILKGRYHESIKRVQHQSIADYIKYPFDEMIVRQRIFATIRLYAKQRSLMALMGNQVYEKEKNNRIMVTILSHIVEFRNGDSGIHVLHINRLTKCLLERLIQKTDKYALNHADISRISTASALHDIGKIGISDEILNKAGKLTEDEFEIMKTHTMIGANILENMCVYKDEPLVKTAYEICRWHHERYNGKGYPDGLKEDEIPISAQVVSLADVYDALVSERVYKKALSHEKAIEMILLGQCGAFNPILLECLLDIQSSIKGEVSGGGITRRFGCRNYQENAIIRKKAS